MRSLKTAATASILFAALATFVQAAELVAIRKVVATPGSIDVAAGQQVTIALTIAKAGAVDVMVLDRDGYAVRTLAVKRQATAGDLLLRWDGRGDDGRLVADEAYSLRVHWSDGLLHDDYFPALEPSPMVGLQTRYYSRSTATISYDLPQASRIHLQAGTSAPGRRNGAAEELVLKTVVNREPRPAGRIAEHWSGLDESGKVYVPGLAHFVIAIASTALPENSIITSGNRQTTFLEHAATRQGASLFPVRRTSKHAHHQGVTALDDYSPPLHLQPLNAAWSQAERLWVVNGPELKLRLSVTGPAAENFRRQPARLYRFLDSRRIGVDPVKDATPIVVIPLTTAGKHLVSLNWQSEYGNVAVNSLHARRARAGEVAAGRGDEARR